MPPKAKSNESNTKVDNKKRKLSEIEHASSKTTTANGTASVGSSNAAAKKPALKRPKTAYSTLSYYPITTMPIVSSFYFPKPSV